MKGKGPLKVFREGNVECALWEQSVKSGEQKSFITVSLKKSWKKKSEEEWKSVQISFHKDELRRVFSVLQQATEELENMLLREEEFV